MTSVLKVDNIQNSSGTSAKIDVHGFSVALLAEEQTSGTSGGTFTSGAWQTRTLNTEVADTNGIVSLSANVFTLGAGTYLIEWSAPVYQVTNHQTRLYDNTNSTVIEYGSTEYASASAGVTNRSFGAAEVTISTSTGYKIEHRCASTYATYGFGTNSSFGNVEVFTQVKITKLK